MTLLRRGLEYEKQGNEVRAYMSGSRAGGGETKTGWGQRRVLSYWYQMKLNTQTSVGIQGL